MYFGQDVVKMEKILVIGLLIIFLQKIKNKRSIWCDKKNLKSRFILGVEAWWIDKTPENEAKLHPALIVWGANDYIFPESGAHPYERDLTDVEKHILDTGHFALENNLDFIAEKISSFLNSRLQ